MNQKVTAPELHLCPHCRGNYDIAYIQPLYLTIIYNTFMIHYDLPICRSLDVSNSLIAIVIVLPILLWNSLTLN